MKGKVLEQNMEGGRSTVYTKQLGSNSDFTTEQCHVVRVCHLNYKLAGETLVLPLLRSLLTGCPTQMVERRGDCGVHALLAGRQTPNTIVVASSTSEDSMGQGGK